VAVRLEVRVRANPRLKLDLQRRELLLHFSAQLVRRAGDIVAEQLANLPHQRAAALRRQRVERRQRPVEHCAAGEVLGA